MTPISWIVVIPAYNAATSVGKVIRGVSKHLPSHCIVVVDDGSSDGTAEAAAEHGVRLVRRERNGGKGCALRDGFSIALESGAEWIICLDADGQHNPEAIPLFQEAAESGEYDLLIGNRRTDSHKMPPLRRFSNSSSSFLLSLRTGLHLPDVQCGFRAIKAESLRRLNLRAEKYNIDAEMVLQAWKRKLKIGWIDIPAIYRGEQSFVRKFPETMRFLKLLVRSFRE